MLECNKKKCKIVMPNFVVCQQCPQLKNSILGNFFKAKIIEDLLKCLSKTILCVLCMECNKIGKT